jgi:hypothetical protein
MTLLLWRNSQAARAANDSPRRHNDHNGKAGEIKSQLAGGKRQNAPAQFAL